MLATAPGLIIGPQVTSGSNPLPTFIDPMAAASRSTNSSWAGASTKNRLAAVQVSAEWRILATIAPSTAASRSASANTTKGALPPSSITVLRIRSAQRRSSIRPTSVEPVNDTMRTARWSTAASNHGPEAVVGTRLTTPGGTPASASSSPTLSAVRGASRGGLTTTVFPAPSAGGELAGDHGRREVPRGDHHHHPHRRVTGDDALVAARGGADRAVDANGLLSVPAEELGRVGHLPHRVGPGLAVLEGDQVGQLVGVLHEDPVAVA